MKKAILLILIFGVFLTPAAAQDAGLQLIDEFGRINMEDLMARSDNLYIQLAANPDSKIVITITGSDYGSPSYSYRLGVLFRNYLLFHRKADPKRVEILNCSVTRPEIETRLYIASPGATLPACDTSLPVFDKTTLFGTANFAGQDDFGCCAIMGEEHAIFRVMMETAGRILEKAPGSKVYLIGYGGTNRYDREDRAKTRVLARKPRGWDSPLFASGKLREAESFFIKQGVERSRIGKINAGYRERSMTVEFWIIPEGDKAPVPAPSYRVGKKAKKRK